MKNFRDFIRYRIEAGRRGFRNLPADEWKIELSTDGFNLSHKSYRSFLALTQTTEQIIWDQVERVFAQKTDNLTWDTIWLTFQLSSGGSLSVPEEASGWDELLDVFPSKLAIPSRAEWWPSVAHPAFAANITQLYPTPI